MAHAMPSPSEDHERQLRLRAMDIVKNLPSDPAEAERILGYAHELLASFLCGAGPSPCSGCEKLMLQPEKESAIMLAFSSYGPVQVRS